MTDLEKRVSEDLLSAMKSKKEMEVSSLRMLKAEFQKAKTEKGRTGDLTEEEVLAVIQRLVKQRRESAEQFSVLGVKDRAEEELREAGFLESYLPEQLSDHELEKAVADAAALVNAAGPRDMGRVMGAVMAAVKGRADGKRVRAKVTEHLQSLGA